MKRHTDLPIRNRRALRSVPVRRRALRRVAAAITVIGAFAGYGMHDTASAQSTNLVPITFTVNVTSPPSDVTGMTASFLCTGVDGTSGPVSNSATFGPAGGTQAISVAAKVGTKCTYRLRYAVNGAPASLPQPTARVNGAVVGLVAPTSLDGIAVAIPGTVLQTGELVTEAATTVVFESTGSVSTTSSPATTTTVAGATTTAIAGATTTTIAGATTTTIAGATTTTVAGATTTTANLLSAAATGLKTINLAVAIANGLPSDVTGFKLSAVCSAVPGVPGGTLTKTVEYGRNGGTAPVQVPIVAGTSCVFRLTFLTASTASVLPVPVVRLNDATFGVSLPTTVDGAAVRVGTVLETSAIGVDKDFNVTFGDITVATTTTAAAVTTTAVATTTAVPTTIPGITTTTARPATTLAPVTVAPTTAAPVTTAAATTTAVPVTAPKVVTKKTTKKTTKVVKRKVVVKKKTVKKVVKK